MAHYTITVSGYDVAPFRVPAIHTDGIYGHLSPDERALVVPDTASVRARLPHQLRKAFDRTRFFTFDKYDREAPCHMSLRRLKDNAHLATIYACIKAG